MCHNSDPHAPSPLLGALPALVTASEAGAEPLPSRQPVLRVFLSYSHSDVTSGVVPNHYAAALEAVQRACARTFTVSSEPAAGLPLMFIDMTSEFHVAWLLGAPPQRTSETLPTALRRLPASDLYRCDDPASNIPDNKQYLAELLALIEKPGDRSVTSNLHSPAVYSNRPTVAIDQAPELSSDIQSPLRAHHALNWLGLGALEGGNRGPFEMRPYSHLSENRRVVGLQHVRPHHPLIRRPWKNNSFHISTDCLPARQHATPSSLRYVRNLFLSISESQQRHIVLQILLVNRLFDRTLSRCVMQNQEKSKSVARVAGLPMIGGAAGLAMRRRPARRKLQKRTEKDRSPRRTGRREHEPGLPESVLNAPGGPIAALLRTAPGVTGGRSFSENFAAFSEDQVPCLVLARSKRPDGIRATLPEPHPHAAATTTPVKPVLH